MKKFLSIFLSFSFFVQFLSFTNFQVNGSYQPVLQLNGGYSDLEISQGEEFELFIGDFQNTGTGRILLGGISYIGATSGTGFINKVGNEIFLTKGFETASMKFQGLETVEDFKVGFDNGSGVYANLTSNSFNINVSNDLKINSAEYLDSDGNGKLETLKIEFNKEPTGGVSTGFLIHDSGNSFSIDTYSLSGSILSLIFSGGSEFNTGITPQLNYNSSIGDFDTLQDIGDSDLTEKDKALSKVFESSVLSAVNSNIQINFSENLSYGTGYLVQSGSSTSITGSVIFIKDEKIIFDPDSDLDISKDYVFNFTARDYFGNENSGSVNVSISASDNESPYGLLIGTSTGIIINNGSEKVLNTNYVNLKLSANDNNGSSSLQMAFSDSEGGIYSSYESYSNSKNNYKINISNGSGTVCVKFKDLSSNISPEYCDNILYGTGNSYLNFDTDSTLYTNSSEITLEGSCNYISSTGAVLGTELTFSHNGTGTCLNKRFSHTFTGLNINGTTIISAQFTGSGAISDSILVTNPSPSCSSNEYYNPPSNATGTGSYPACDFSCNSLYHKKGTVCESNTKSCVVSNGNGSQTWNGTSWSECQIVSCNSGYYQDGESCVLPTGTWSYSCPTSCGLSSQVFVGTSCSGGNCFGPAQNVTCPATSSCSTSSSSSGGGGGGGGGGSFGPTVGNYTLPSSESDKLVDVIDNIDLKKLENGVLTRPLKISEIGKKYFVEIEKGTVIKDEKGEFFNGKILAPVRLSTSKLPNINTKTKEISKGKYALRAIEVGAEEGSLIFDKDIKITISVKGISEKLSRNFIDVYSYDENGEKYQLENKNRVFDSENDAITVSVNHMTKFIAVWENGGASDSGNSNSNNNIGGGFEEGVCKIKDISTHWSNEFVSELCNEGIVSGEGETGLFKPDNFINRAALLKMLMISFGYEIESTFSEKYFQDINGDERFANYVNTAKKMGLIEGYKVENDLKINYTLQEKSTGKDVLILQNFLTEKGFYDYTVTGYFGGLTKLALQKYQQSVGISTTGILGSKTLARVNSDLDLQNGDFYKFKPAEYINRAEALAMILKVAKKSVGLEIGDFNEFQDVSKNSWFANFVKYGFENGIISGKSKGIFSPSGNITKGEVSKIIVKTRSLK